MSNPYPGQGHNHQRRFYLLMMVVVVGGILFLLLINDEGKLSLTGSSIGTAGEKEETKEEVLKEISQAGKGEIDFKLSFDTGPEVKEETSLQSLALVFDDLNTRIKINDEELELKGLEKVEMVIENFRGEIDFDEVSISLKGKAERVVVNGLGISTPKESLDISFTGLTYESLAMKGVKFSLVEFRVGSGELALGEKLKYTLEDEKVKISKFKGDLGIGREGDSLVTMEGALGGISVEGEFDLTLS